jgi:glucose-6-phosphate 1-dehydrogenase
MAARARTPADVLVIFGITGDLAKKMTFRSLYRLERRGMLHCPIIGVARDEWSSPTLREHARRAIEDSGEIIDEEVFLRFAERLSMISGDYKRGSWGPASAETLLTGHPRWREPWLHSRQTR